MKQAIIWYQDEVGRVDMDWSVMEKSKEEFIDIVKAIQLDAYKAGLKKAQEIGLMRARVLGVPLVRAGQIQQAIEQFHNNLTELPKE